MNVGRGQPTFFFWSIPLYSLNPIPVTPKLKNTNKNTPRLVIELKSDSDHVCLAVGKLLGKKIWAISSGFLGGGRVVLQKCIEVCLRFLH